MESFFCPEQSNACLSLILTHTATKRMSNFKHILRRKKIKQVLGSKPSFFKFQDMDLTIWNKLKNMQKKIAKSYIHEPQVMVIDIALIPNPKLSPLHLFNSRYETPYGECCCLTLSVNCSKKLWDDISQLVHSLGVNEIYLSLATSISPKHHL